MFTLKIKINVYKNLKYNIFSIKIRKNNIKILTITTIITIVMTITNRHQEEGV
jgi:hypothetical protein